MAIGLDTTAHPGGTPNNISGVHGFGNNTNTITTSAFSTGPGPILLVACIVGDAAGLSEFTITNTSGLTWTPRVANIVEFIAGAAPRSAHFTVSSSGTSIMNVTAVSSGTLKVGDQVAIPGATVSNNITSFGSGTGGIGTYNLAFGTPVATNAAGVCGNGIGTAIYTAFSATGNLTSETITFTCAVFGQGMGINVTILNGVPATETACIGTPAGYSNLSTSQVVSQSITPSATGSWLIGVCYDDAVAITLSPNSSTSSFDFTESTIDSWAWGRYKSSGTVTTTTALTPVLFGATDNLGADSSVSVLEILLPAAAFRPDEDYSRPYIIHQDQYIISVW